MGVTMFTDVPVEDVREFDQEISSAIRLIERRGSPPEGITTVSWAGYITDLTELRDELDTELHNRSRLHNGGAR